MSKALEQRSLVVEYMKSRKKKNSYTQGSKRSYFFGHPDNKPGNTTQAGYSDCSAAVRACIKAVTGIDIGSNTSAQVNNRNKKGLVVHTTDGYYPDESKLLPGDCLYFKGNTSHPLDVGHVEMYTGPNECYGHGSGTGPTKKDLKSYCKSRGNSKKRYFMAVRWILDDGSPDSDPNTLSYGSEGESVKILQQNLIALGFDCGSYGADGDFGSATQAAVTAFQEAQKLPATGIADEATLKKIAELLDLEGDNENNEQILVPVPNGITVNKGSWNVRTGPGVEFSCAGVVRSGDVLEKVDIGDWIPVMYNGELRFLSPKAVKN